MLFAQAVAGLLGLFWSSQFLLMGMYGAQFSWWIPVVALASLSLLVGAVAGRFSRSAWIGWLPILGGGVLAAYFVPALAYVVVSYSRGESEGGWSLALQLITVGLILLDFLHSTRSKLGVKKS